MGLRGIGRNAYFRTAIGRVDHAGDSAAGRRPLTPQGSKEESIWRTDRWHADHVGGPRVVDQERQAAMNWRKPGLQELRLELGRLANFSGTVQERAADILELLGRVLVFDAGWLAVRDPERRHHFPLATSGDAAPLRDYFGSPEADAEVDELGLNGRRPPLLASEMPGQLSDVRVWRDHLLPAGFRQGLGAGLFTDAGRHVGLLGLLSADPSRPSLADREIIAAVTPMIADGLDRTRDIADTARIIERAEAGVVMTRGGKVLPLPGLPDHHLLAQGSPILAVAADELAISGPYTSFLAPSFGADGERLIRVTALDFDRPDLDHLSAAVLLCQPGDLLSLAVVDLRVLGLMAHGTAGIADIGRTLHLAEKAVVDSVMRSCTALGADDVTVATTRAMRRGMRIPPGVMRQT